MKTILAAAAKALAQQRAAAEMRAALRRGEFGVVYQPVIDLKTYALVGVEALSRWGDRNPADFIRLAEDTDVIIEIGDWVLRTALSQAAAWNSISASPLAIAVNVSRRQMHSPGFAERVCSAIVEHRLSPGGVVLEITETAMANDHELMITACRALRSCGVQLALDDFGVGYSALSAIREYPIDIIKIDRAFVAPIASGVTAYVDMITTLGRHLGLRVIAEGVETPEQAKTLLDIGCDLAQGYYFAQPLSADGLTALIVASQMNRARTVGDDDLTPRRRARKVKATART